MAEIETILLVAAALLLLSVIASKTSGRLGVPSLLIFVVIGMLAGSEGPGGIAFDDPALAQSLGVLALVLILFAGGVDTEWSAVRAALFEGIALATGGVLITAALPGLDALARAPDLRRDDHGRRQRLPRRVRGRAGASCGSTTGSRG